MEESNTVNTPSFAEEHKEAIITGLVVGGIAFALAVQLRKEQAEVLILAAKVAKLDRMITDAARQGAIVITRNTDNSKWLLMAKPLAKTMEKSIGKAVKMGIIAKELEKAHG